MPFQNRLQFDWQWEFMIPLLIYTWIGLIAQVSIVFWLTMFWNLSNQNFNTLIAQTTLTSEDREWKTLFIDLHIDRE